MAIENSYNFRRISDRLTTSGVIGENRIRGLAAEGYEILINLLPDDNEHTVAGEKEIVEAQGVEYVYIPVDFLDPTEEDFAKFAAAMDAAADHRTHVHCAANWRVSAFYACYALPRGLMTNAEAWELISGLWEPVRFPVWQQFIARHLPGLTTCGSEESTA